MNLGGRRDAGPIVSAMVIATILIMSVQAVSVSAEQPYIGGYGSDGTAGPTIKAAAMTNWFASKDGDTYIEEPLESVLTTVGTSGGLAGINGFIYQGVMMWDENYIFSNDQVWGPNQGKTVHDELWHVPVTLTFKTVFHRATTNQFMVGTSYVDFQHIVYHLDGFSFSNTERYTKTSWDTTANFYFGQCTGSTCFSGNPSGRTYRFFNFGLETPVEEPLDYKVSQKSIAYKLVTATQWHYITDTPAYLAHGDQSNYVAWWLDNTGAKRPVSLGGFPYRDVFAKAALTDGSLPAGQVAWDSRDCGGNKCQLPLPVRLW